MSARPSSSSEALNRSPLEASIVTTKQGAWQLPEFHGVVTESALRNLGYAAGADSA